MPRSWSSSMIFLPVIFGGCSGLGETIKGRVVLAETCRQVLEAPLPAGAVPNAYLASIRIGDVSSCQYGQGDGILALCAFDQIWKKYEGSGSASAVGAATADVAAVATAKRTFKESFEELRTELRKLANNNKLYWTDDWSRLSPEAKLAGKQRAAQQTVQQMADINRQLLMLRGNLAALKATLIKAAPLLGEQASIELAAWDSNVRIQLDQLEQVLTGNISLLVAETLKDQVVRHVAKRSLNLLHGALKPAQAVIDRLDDKAYGLISVSYLGLQPNLQKAVNSAYDNVKSVYENRVTQMTAAASSTTEKSKYVTAFIGEMQRAACENLIEGTSFSMTSELVDTMLISKVQESKILSPDKNGKRVPAHGALALPIRLIPASFLMDDATVLPTNALEGPIDSPLSVYVSNEWAARQQLLIKSISEQRKAGGTAPQFPGVGTINEAEVRRLADAATAQVIDDASRSNPALLDSRVAPLLLSSALSSNVNVVVAASAVSQANAVLTANLSNSNVNTFAPTNHNAPVFNLPAYPAGTGSGQTPQPPSLCSGGSFGDTGATCMYQGGDYIIVFGSGVGYAGDACQGDNARDRLAKVAGIVRSYGDRHGVRFETSVAGYASLTPAALKKCDAARQPRHVVCTYRNMAREEIAVQGCAAPNGDKNLLLSAARAKDAAAMLEQASGGSLLVRRLAARGAQVRDDIHAYDPAAEQTVVLRFRPAE